MWDFWKTNWFLCKALHKSPHLLGYKVSTGSTYNYVALEVVLVHCMGPQEGKSREWLPALDIVEKNKDLSSATHTYPTIKGITMTSKASQRGH